MVCDELEDAQGGITRLRLFLRPRELNQPVRHVYSPRITPFHRRHARGATRRGPRPRPVVLAWVALLYRPGLRSRALADPRATFLAAAPREKHRAPRVRCASLSGP